MPVKWICVATICTFFSGCAEMAGAMRIAPELADGTVSSIRPAIRRVDRPFSIAEARVDGIELDRVHYDSHAIDQITHVIATRDFRFHVSDGTSELHSTCTIRTRYIVKQDAFDKALQFIKPEIDGYTLEPIEGNPSLDCGFTGDHSASLRMQTHYQSAIVTLTGEVLFDDDEWALESVHESTNGRRSRLFPLGLDVLRDGRAVAQLTTSGRASVRLAKGLTNEDRIYAFALFAALTLYDPERLDPPMLGANF